MSVLAIRLSKRLEEGLDKETRLEKKSRSVLVREALAEFLKRREERRFMGQMIREMRGRDPGQARADLAMAEEAVAYDNEALDLSGDPAPGESEEKWWR